MKDLERDHVIETVVIHRPDLTITDARLPFPTGHVDHLHPMDLRVGRIGLKSEDVVYLLEDAGRRVIARVLRETKAVMAWDVSQRMGEVGTPRLLKTVADPSRVEEEFHPLQDSTQSVAEVPREGEESEVSRALLHAIDNVFFFVYEKSEWQRTGLWVLEPMLVSGIFWETLSQIVDRLD